MRIDATSESRFFMKILKYLLVSSVLLFQTSLCFGENSINVSFYPDPFNHCNQYGVDVAITNKSTLGTILGSCNSDRPTYGQSNSQVENNFNRVLISWRYSPKGALRSGNFIEATVGEEKSEFRSAAGSRSNVTFIDTELDAGYQWFWNNGFNVSIGGGVAHLIRNSGDKSISPSESSDIIGFLDKNTRTNTHTGLLFSLGWSF